MPEAPKVPAQPRLILVLLDQQTQQFKVVTDQTLKLQSTGPGQTSLGYIEPRPRVVDGTPLLKDGKPEMEMAFVPVLNYPVEIAQPSKLELATSVPDALKKTSKVSRKKVN